MAEVLIALFLLGVVAMFLIPKVMQAMEEAHKKAIFREAVGEVGKIITEAHLKGLWSITAAENDSLLQEKLNLLRVNPSVVDAGGITNYYYILKNGAKLQYRQGALRHPGFIIDYNGDQPPQQEFQDRMRFWANLEGVSWCGINPGGIGPPDPNICPQFVGALYTNQEFKDYFMQMVVN